METRQRRPSGKKRPAASSAGRTKTAARQPSASAVKKKKRTTVSSPDVVYTPPKPLNRAKLLLGLATTVTVVLALIFGISIFFKVETVLVSGTEKYDAWTVMEASGIEIGDNLLGISDAKVSGKIQSALPYVSQVRVGINLPDTVNIEIVEIDVWYAIQDVYDIWWLMTADGRVVEQVDAATAGDCTKILGVQLAAPVPGRQAVAAEYKPTVDIYGNTIPVTVIAAEQLDAALQILHLLEQNSVIGDVVHVDVSYLTQLELQYGQQYTVSLGDTSQMEYKIYCMKSAVDQLAEYETGTIDVSFSIMDQPIYSRSD